MNTILDTIRKLGEKETEITKKVFVSPIFMNTLVATRVAGVAYTFTIPKTKQGWYQIQPKDARRAEIKGSAEMLEVEEYLGCLDKLRLVLVMKRDGVYLGVPDKSNKFRFRLEDMLPVYLCDDMPMDFDRVIARYDGKNFWYDRVDQGNDPAKAEYLRQSMLKLTDPEKIRFSGLTVEERFAYTIRMTLDKKLAADRKKEGIKQDVEFAGGAFVNFVERADHYSVTYKVDGQEYTSHVAKDPKRSVISAGLCLAGDDRKFDLKSLVTVIREAQEKDIVHHYHLR